MLRACGCCFGDCSVSLRRRHWAPGALSLRDGGPGGASGAGAPDRHGRADSICGGRRQQPPPRPHAVRRRALAAELMDAGWPRAARKHARASLRKPTRARAGQTRWSPTASSTAHSRRNGSVGVVGAVLLHRRVGVRRWGIPRAGWVKFPSRETRDACPDPRRARDGRVQNIDIVQIAFPHNVSGSASVVVERVRARDKLDGFGGDAEVDRLFHEVFQEALRRRVGLEEEQRPTPKVTGGPACVAQGSAPAGIQDASEDGAR